ncbi:hypothetical protein GGF46_000561 [Coemansia sp. RSA 552]|nr:hypothetical protein GGF46_000561 [Coemansia sp. RSA 552]
MDGPGLRTTAAAALGVSKSASVATVQPLYLRGGRPAIVELPPLNTSLADMHGCQQAQLPSPRDGGAYLTSSHRFPISPGSSDSEESGGFTPYLMEIVQPKAPELRHLPRHSAKASTASSTMVPPSSSTPGAVSFATPSGLLTPNDESSGSGSSRSSTESMPQHRQQQLLQQQQEGVNTAMRIRRSLSTLLQRSSSVLRRGDAGLRRQNTAVSRAVRKEGPSPALFRRSDAPPPAANIANDIPRALGPSDLEGALAISQFNVNAANTMVSPLIGNSMVHVKVIVDGTDNVVVVPIIYTMVFARVRERILTKLFQGGVPFVESKPRRLAVRRPDGSLAPIRDNPTWRTVMDIAARTTCQKPRSAGGCGGAVQFSAKTVVKLTLQLTETC